MRSEGSGVAGHGIIRCMSYLVLARKWRPRRFAELVGQEHVVRALTNALDSGRVHHAFPVSYTHLTLPTILLV